MKKYIAPLSTVTGFLALTSQALAQATVPLSAPDGSIKTFCLTRVPQFIIQLLFVVGVIAAVAFLIYGGVKWILSGGDEKQVEAARNHIIAAIIGLIIVVGAFFILGLVFQILGIGIKDNPITNLQIRDLQGGLISC